MNTVLTLSAASCAAVAAWLVLAPPRGAGVLASLAARPPSGRPVSPSSTPSSTWEVGAHGAGPLLLVCAVAGSAPVLLIGGPVGVLAGPVLAAWVWRTLRGREPAHVRRRRQEVARALPLTVDLLAVVLAAGASPARALRTVADAVGAPIGEDLARVEHGLTMGRDPARVWSEVAGMPGLEALGRVMARAIDTGAPVADALHRLSEDLAAEARLTVDTRARAVAVRAAAPLGLCLLPAFVLIGVVPLVAGTVASLTSR